MIYKMRPLLMPRIWGGHRLDKHFGEDRIEPIGEAWLVADLVEGFSSTVSGRSFTDLVSELGSTMRGAFGDRFPLLVKIIDADADLSIQVHPSHTEAKRFPGAQSKDESWLILDARDDAYIYFGFNRKYSESQVREALIQGTITDLLEKVQVRAGDVFRIGPGTVHAIGKGITLLEVQEPSDTTFRVYDYERPGLDGKPRALHVEEAMSVATLDRAPRIEPRDESGWTLHAVGDHYAMLGKRIEGSAQVPGTGPRVIIALGDIEIRAGEQESRLGRWEAAVIPAGIEANLFGYGDVVVATTVAPRKL
jgi:mannose-6-phosphate isomerase class I